MTRWKGRAFQQSPNSTISVVGFEDEQVNWEANAALLGWKAGPVRAIREVWGADSGTNVTKTEIYYRDAHRWQYHLRVHPIPPDGLYSSWDSNLGAVSTYYTQLQPTGVPIDGHNDNIAHVDSVPVSGQPGYLDTCDPTFDVCSAFHNPEEVAGPNGGIVYNFDIDAATTALNPAVVPYYRDDACLDDGTGDGPAPRPWPKETTSDPRVQQGYVDYWKAHGAPATLTYADLDCQDSKNPSLAATLPPWKRHAFSAAIGQHGVHFFATHDTDNAASPAPVTELVGSEWAYSVPMSAPTNRLADYGPNVNTPLQVVVAPGAQMGSPAPGASATPSSSATPSAGSSPSATPVAGSSPSPTTSPSSSPTPGPSALPTASASPTAAPGASPSPSASPVASPSAGPPSPSPSPSPSPTPGPPMPGTGGGSYQPQAWVVGAKGTDGAHWSRATGERGWEDDGGVMLGAPAELAVTDAHGNSTVAMIATGADHDLWTRVRGGAGWQLLFSGPHSTWCQDNPAATIADGRLYVGCEGRDRGLWWISAPAPGPGALPQVSGAWNNGGGILTAGPAAASLDGSSVTWFVNGDDHGIWVSSGDGSFAETNWRCYGHPAAQANGTGARFACQGTDQALWYDTYVRGDYTTPRWLGAASLGGALVDGPAIAETTSVGSLFFVEGTDGAVWARTFQQDWSSLGGQVRAGTGGTAY